MRSKFLKGFAFVVLIVILLVLNSQTVVNTKEDEQYIEAFSKEWALPTNTDSIHASFENEIAFIARLQDEAVRTVEQVEIAHRYFGNIRYYFTNRQGYCY